MKKMGGNRKYWEKKKGKGRGEKKGRKGIEDEKREERRDERKTGIKKEEIKIR
jgi:hypothetical protein